MPYDWSFFTEGRPIFPEGRRCHRGPMIDVEIVMSKPFLMMSDWDYLRARVEKAIVDINLVTVQTRETVLRSLNNQLGPIFQRLASQKKELQVLICEKRNSVDIERDLQDLNVVFIEKLPTLISRGVQKQHIDLLLAAIKSNSVIMRVAGKAATILLVSFIEMDA
jgi:hypothetical protein